MKKMRLTILVALCCLVALLMSFAVSAAAPTNGWYQEDGDWYYYRDGSPVCNEVLTIGGVKYAFLWDGRMLDNYEEHWVDNGYYRAKPGGALMTNQWYEEYGEMYYYGADGKGYSDFQTVGGKEYFFADYGMVAKDQAVYSNARGGYYALSKDGTQFRALNKNGWNEAFGQWYYIQDGNCLYDTALKLGAKTYYFDGRGQMSANEFAWFWNAMDEGVYGYFGADGCLQTGWFKIGNDWAYANAYGNVYEEDVYEIDGKLYYFNNYRMYNVPGERGEYYITASGALLRNQWYKDDTGSEYEIGWAYYNDNGQRLYDTLWRSGSVYYYFNWAGVAVTNDVMVTSYGVILFNGEGAGTVKNGWFTHPETGEDVYAYNGELANGPVKIGNVTYGFYPDGTLVKNKHFWDYDSDVPYLCNENGQIIQTVGWHKVNGYWYYVRNTTGALYSGLARLNGKDYYFNPKMVVAQMVECDGKFYVADTNGVCAKLTGNGLTTVWGSWYFLVNGEPLREQWRQVSGEWYYFTEGGWAVSWGTYKIDGKRYLFNRDGVLVTNGWYGNYYADQNGVVVTGLKTIGGKQYLFNMDGYSIRGELYQYNGVFYLTAPDGIVLGSAAKKGWNQIGNDWYYVDKDGNLLTECLLTLGSVTYGFGSDGKMCKNGVKYAWYDYYIFDANGKILTGWQKIDGAWYYSVGGSDPLVYQNGVYTIGGKEYVFKGCRLQIGTFVYAGIIYTTDADGAVVKQTDLPNGWTYSDGDVLYRKNGALYTGWVGDYYVSNGYMLFNTKIQYGGSYYYLGMDGRYLRNSLFITEYGTIIAKSDGTLVNSGWYKYGKDWYYFNNAVAVTWECYIDGQEHIFDENGKWQGVASDEENTNPSMSNGWHKIGGKWYYYVEGHPLTGDAYIDGAYYFFHNDGTMLADGVENWYGYYYGTDGKRAAVTGWKQVDGKWMYFDNTHTYVWGLISSGSGWYYTTDYYDADTGLWSEGPVMVTNYAHVEGGRLYHFGSNGYCSGYVNKTGWYQVGADWYYLENGYVVHGYRVINGAGYYFSNGRMITNADAWAEVNGKGCTFYFGTDGKRITKDGWHQDRYGWIYIQNGELLYEGIYKINGKDYTFVHGYWVQ